MADQLIEWRVVSTSAGSRGGAGRGEARGARGATHHEKTPSDQNVRFHATVASVVNMPAENEMVLWVKRI